MGRFVRKQALFFMIGFVVVFVIYLFIQFDSDDVIKGIFISLLGGAAGAVGFNILERRVGNDTPAQK